MHSILSLLSIAAFHSLVAGYQIPTFLTARQQEGRFLHITDIHLDTLYVEGADLEAGCHVKKSRSALDAPVSGKYGSPMSGCDAPLTLVNLTFTTLAKDFASSLDFVIWTGDSVRHDSDPKIPRTMDEVQALNTQVTSMMRETFPKIPILPSIGNNDVHPHNELAFYSNESVNEMLEFFADIWSLWIPQDQVSAFKKHGNFFMDLIPGKLIGLSFNTMYLFNSNSFSVKCGQSNAQESPGDVALDWLSKTLEMARKEGLQVYITGHVPPNTVNFLDSCYYSFAKRCQEFRDVIQGQFYGHMNIDHFYFPTLNEYPMLHLDKKAASPYPHVMVNDRGERHVPSWVAAYFQNLLGHYKYVAKELEPIAMPIMVAPSVVPAFNPGFRIFQYSSEATTLKYPIGTLLGYDQYYMDLERWNETPDRLKGSLGVPSFALEYQPALAYNITQDSLSTPTWIDLAWQLTHKPKKGKSRDEKKGKKKKKHHRKDKKKDKIHTKKKEYSVPSSPGSPSAESHRGKERDSLLKIYLRHLMVSVKEFSEVEDDIDE